MQSNSSLTSPRSTAPHRRWPVIGRLLTPIRGPILRIVPLLLLGVVGSTAAAAAPLPLTLTALHFQYGLDFPDLGSFPNGFDHLNWSADKAGATRFTIKYTAKSQNFTLTLPLGGSPQWAEMPRATEGGASLGVFRISYRVEGYKNNILVSRSNAAECGEILPNGGFSPANPGANWEQTSTNRAGRGSFLKASYARLGGVDSTRDTISTLSDYDVPNLGATTTQFRQLEFSGKVRCDTTDATNAVYDSLVCIITDAHTGVQLNTSRVLCSNLTAGDWFEFGENLPYDKFAGKTLRLTFVATTDSSLPTTFFIKEVTLNHSISYK